VDEVSPARLVIAVSAEAAAEPITPEEVEKVLVNHFSDDLRGLSDLHRLRP
jgi:hypothetical protein